MTDDVDWPNAWEGGRGVGHAAVRDYWTRQWAAIDPTVEPVSVATRADGSVADGRRGERVMMLGGDDEFSS